MSSDKFSREIPATVKAELDRILDEANGASDGVPAPSPTPGKEVENSAHWVSRDGVAVLVRRSEMAAAEREELGGFAERARSGEAPLSETPVLLGLEALGERLSILHGASGLVPRRIDAAADVYRGMYRDYGGTHEFAGRCVGSNSMPIWFGLRDLPGMPRVRVFVNRALPMGRVVVRWMRDGR